MSGHSKWATTKHRKGAKDSARAKVFAKLIRQVEVAAREGGGDLDANASLRTMYQKAREASVPLDTIERAIKRGTGELEGVRYEPITYEGYGPGGVAVIVETLTDNRNRTSAEIKHLFAQERRHHRRARRGLVAVRPQGRHRGQGPARRGPAPRVGHGRRRRELQANGDELHRHDRAPRRRPRCATPSRRSALKVLSAELTLVPQNVDPGRRRGRGEEDPAPDGRDRRPRRRPERLRQLRHPRRDPGAPSRAKSPSRRPGRRDSIERMFVLGIDPGLTRCGFGLVEGSFEGARVVSAPCAPASSRPTPRDRRRASASASCWSSCARSSARSDPDAVVVERVFYQRNAKTAIPVAQASGVAVALAGAVDLPGAPVHRPGGEAGGHRLRRGEQVPGPGHGRAALRTREVPEPADAADALALAITYFMVVRTEQRYPLASPA